MIDRRSFITRALGLLAALPFVGKIAQAKTNKMTLTMGEQASFLGSYRWRFKVDGEWSEWKTSPVEFEMTSPRVDFVDTDRPLYWRVEELGQAKNNAIDGAFYPGS